MGVNTVTIARYVSSREVTKQEFEPTLKAVSTLSLLAYNIQNSIDELSSFGVVCRSNESAMSHDQARQSCQLASAGSKTRTTRVVDGTKIVNHSRPFAQLLPAPLCPKTKLSGRKRGPRGPERTESMVPGSRSTRTARGTYLLAPTSL